MATAIRETHLRHTVDPVAYRRRIEGVLAVIDDIGPANAEQVVGMLDDFRRQVVEIMSELPWTVLEDGTRIQPSRAMYERALEGIDQAAARFAARFGVALSEMQTEAARLGSELVIGPLEAAGVQLDMGPAGLSGEAAMMLSTFRADLVQGITDEARRRISGEVASVVGGAKTPFEAMTAVGRNLTERNHFTTIAARARAIVTTEIGRAQAISTQGEMRRLQQTEIPELRKRWLSSHVRDFRQTHLDAENRYRVGGSVGPIPVDEPYHIAGIPAMYPRDPSLPPRESVHCHCHSIPVLPETEETAVSPAEVQAEEEQQAEIDADPAEQDRRERLERLAKPMERPAGWDRMSNGKRLRWLEDRMSDDWPIGIDKRQKLRRIEMEPVPWDPSRKRKRWVSEPNPNYGKPAPTVFHLAGHNADTVWPTMQEMRRLGAAYPRVAERLQYVGTYRGKRGEGWRTWALKPGSPAFRQREYAHASRDGLRIGLNPRYYGKDPDELATLLRRDYEMGWHPIPDPEGIITHEWGHQVQNWIGAEYGDRTLLPGVPANGFGSPGEIGEAILRLSPPKALSDYSLESRREYFAELFAFVERPQIAARGAGATVVEEQRSRMGALLEHLRGDPRTWSLKDRPTLFELSGPRRAAYDRAHNELLEILGGEFGPFHKSEAL